MFLYMARWEGLVSTGEIAAAKDPTVRKGDSLLTRPAWSELTTRRQTCLAAFDGSAICDVSLPRRPLPEVVDDDHPGGGPVGIRTTP